MYLDARIPYLKLPSVYLGYLALVLDILNILRCEVAQEWALNFSCGADTTFVIYLLLAVCFICFYTVLYKDLHNCCMFLNDFACLERVRGGRLERVRREG